MREMSFQKQRDTRYFLMHCLTLNALTMQTSTHNPLYWGRTYDQEGVQRFVFWHRRFDYLIQVSGFLRDDEVYIEQLKRGIQVRPTAGLPHFGYAFDWQPLKHEADTFFLVHLGVILQKWTMGQELPSRNITSKY